MEAELKLLINKADLPKLDKLALIEGIALDKPLKQELVNVYYDTPEFEIHRAGLGLRVRHVNNGQRLQTLKADGKVDAGLHKREEWEAEITDDRPDLDALREMVGHRLPYAKTLTAPGLADRLEPIFTTKVNRTVRNLRLRTGDDVEMAIDHGTIECKQSSEPICEIELELKSGVPANLYNFALEILDAVPMQLGTRSKAERGYALYEPSQKQIIKATKLDLRPSMSVEEAFEAIVANCMKQVQGNEYGVTHGTDPESIHQMRVGLRRLRSALDLFKETIECPSFMQEEWKWLASELGSARDWEVMADSTLAYLEEIPFQAGLDVAALKEAALKQARQNREKAASAVTSARHARIQLRFAEWMAVKGWRGGLPGHPGSLIDSPLKKFAKSVLRQAEERLLKRGKRLKENDPESRHRVRIAAKKARYATEFFASLFPKSRVKDYVSHLSELQQELGWLNDAAVGVERLNMLQLQDQHAANSAVFARGYLFATVHQDHPHLMNLWKQFAHANPPYRS